jgi:hypothetical protein
MSSQRNSFPRFANLSMMLVLGLGFAVATPASAEPARTPAAKPSLMSRLLHPARTIRTKIRRERALHKLQLKVRSMPRVSVKFHQRFGKLGGKEHFGSKSDWLGLLTGTAINVGGLVDPQHAVQYFLASTVVGLGTVATHVVKRSLLRRKTTVSMVEDKTISDTVLKPFRKDLGLSTRNRKLTPSEPKPAEGGEGAEGTPTPTTPTATATPNASNGQ